MRRFFVFVVVACVLAAVPALAADPVVYPAKGQSAEQQERDEFECHQWATKDTGVDPEALAEQKLAVPTPAEKHGSGAASAGVGAVRGAAEGDAAAGAARGFGIGRMISVLRSKRQLRESQSAQTEDGAALHNQLDKYDRAYAACLSGRGYSVK